MNESDDRSHQHTLTHYRAHISSVRLELVWATMAADLSDVVEFNDFRRFMARGDGSQ